MLMKIGSQTSSLQTFKTSAKRRGVLGFIVQHTSTMMVVSSRVVRMCGKRAMILVMSLKKVLRKYGTTKTTEAVEVLLQILKMRGLNAAPSAGIVLSPLHYDGELIARLILCCPSFDPNSAKFF
jgi:hypothetical protein